MAVSEGHGVSFSREDLIVPLGRPRQFVSVAREHRLQLLSRRSISVRLPPTSLTQCYLKWCSIPSVSLCLRRGFLSAVRHLVGRWGGCSWMLMECVRAGSRGPTVRSQVFFVLVGRGDVGQRWTWGLRIQCDREAVQGHPSQSISVMHTQLLSISFSAELMFTQAACNRSYKLTQGAETEEGRHLIRTWQCIKSLHCERCKYVVEFSCRRCRSTPFMYSTFWRDLSWFTLSFERFDVWESSIFFIPSTPTTRVSLLQSVGDEGCCTASPGLSVW